MRKEKAAVYTRLLSSSLITMEEVKEEQRE
jgi:hypothetical protein